MAEKIVKGVDIVEKGALSEHIEQAKQLLIVYKQLDDEVKSTASSLAKMSKGFKATKTGDVGTAKATSDNMNKAMLEQERIAQAQIRTKKALLQLEKAQEQQANKTAKAVANENNAYTKQSKELNTLRNQYKNLAAQNQSNTKEAKALLAEITKLDAKLKGIDKTVGQSQRNVGNYTSALDRLKGVGIGVTNVLGQLGLAMGIGMIVKGATDTIVEFDSAIADLSAITGASGKDLDFFKENAIRMGVDVKGGAAAVVEAYKLIASAKPELLENAAALNSVTEAAILLSRASGMELPDAATALTDAMNQFGVGAEQAGKFVDVLAAGAKFGSAEIPQITEALLKFGAVAKTTNVNIQESTGLIEALAEKGLKGAEAGTALRNVMLKLSAPDALPKEAQDRLAALGVNFDDLKDKSKPFAERLEALKPLLSDNGALIKVFGTENAVAATTLLSSTDRIKELTASVNENGVALEQANVRSSTISEAFNRLKETINGLILSFVNGKGAAGGFVSILDFLTRNIKTILTVVYQLGKAFVIYKTTMLAINVATKAQTILNQGLGATLKNLFVAQNSVTGAVDKGSKSVKLFGMSLNAVPFAAIITGIIALVSSLETYDEKLQKTIELHDEFIAKGQEAAKGFLEASSVENYISKGVQSYNEAVEAGMNRGTAFTSVSKLIMGDIEFERKKIEKELDSVILFLQKNKGKLSQDVLFEKTAYAESLKIELQTFDDFNKKLWDAIQEDKKKSKSYSVVQKDAIQDVSDTVDKTNKVYEKRKDLLTEIIEKEEDVRQLIDVPEPAGVGFEFAEVDDGMDDYFEEQQRLRDEAAAAEEKRKADLIQLAQDLTEISTFLTDRRIEAIDREIEAEKRKYEESKQNIDAIIAMREMDSNSMAQSIAFEKAEQAKALAAQEKLQRKKQRLELLNTSIGMLNAQIAAGNGNPLGKTMADVTTLIGFIKSIPMFWEGTETTVGDSVGTKFSNGRDGILARVDKSEMILNKSKVDKLAAMGIHSTDDVVKRLMLGNGISNVPTSMVAMNDNSDMVAKLDEHSHLLKQLVNKPVTNTTLEQVGKVVKMIETVNKPHRNIVTVKQKRIS